MSKATQDDTEPLWFWRETELPHGYMSQWYPCTFVHEGTTYCSTEQWMMSQKALLFGDAQIAEQIAATSDPAKQRTLGRKVKNFDREKWDEHKYTIVEQGNYLKFTQSRTTPGTMTKNPTPDTPLKPLLLQTGARELVEASPYDRIWGIGFAANDADKTPRERWGENLLGRALMAVRERLRREEDEEAGRDGGGS